MFGAGPFVGRGKLPSVPGLTLAYAESAVDQTTTAVTLATRVAITSLSFQVTSEERPYTVSLYSPYAGNTTANRQVWLAIYEDGVFLTQGQFTAAVANASSPVTVQSQQRSFAAGTVKTYTSFFYGGGGAGTAFTLPALAGSKSWLKAVQE